MQKSFIFFLFFWCVTPHDALGNMARFEQRPSIVRAVGNSFIGLCKTGAKVLCLTYAEYKKMRLDFAKFFDGMNPQMPS